MFFVNYLSLSPFIQEKSGKAGRKEQDIGVRGPLGPPRYSICEAGVGRARGPGWLRVRPEIGGTHQNDTEFDSVIYDKAPPAPGILVRVSLLQLPGSFSSF